MMKILLMGLPGAGKTTLANELKKHLTFKHFNADEIRKLYNDWDFSPEGRLRQATRMRELAYYENAHGIIAICDFVCPTDEYRNAFGGDLLIFVDTIDESRFEDTNKVFQKPENPDYVVKQQKCEVEAPKLASFIMKKVKEKNYPNRWNNQHPTVQMLGRWQPWHPGHRWLFEQALEKTGQVNIMIRDVAGVGENIFDFTKAARMIHEDLEDEYTGKYIVTQVPNIVDISYGRGVGYSFTEHVPPKEIHDISATKIREEMKNNDK
jgi:adenylylsulfate kinase